MATALDIIQDSLRRLGVLAQGETATAQDAADALTRLNDMLAAFETEAIDYLHVPFTALTNTVPMPESEHGHIKALLAVALAPDYDRVPHPLLMQQAQAAERALIARYAKPLEAEFDPAFNSIYRPLS